MLPQLENLGSESPDYYKQRLSAQEVKLIVPKAKTDALDSTIQELVEIGIVCHFSLLATDDAVLEENDMVFQRKENGQMSYF